MFKIKIGQ